MAVLLAVAATAHGDARTSGTELLSDALRAQQIDEAANPGMLWVAEGETLWRTNAGSTSKSCATCHGSASEGMKGVAARYPRFDEGANTLLNLEGRINRCRTVNQGAEAFTFESDALLALTAFVARQSLGMPIGVAIDGPAAPFYNEGEAFFHRRQGQLNLSCAQCHDDNVGRHLRGDTISHATTTGYPAYRLEWQSLGSLQRRLRACSLGVRARQFDYGARGYLSLELYLAKRSEGLAIETPAVRR